MIIIKIIFCALFSVVYSLPDIQPVPIDILMGQFPTFEENNFFIPHLSKACTLFNLNEIQNEIMYRSSGRIHFQKLTQNGIKYKSILIKLLKFIDANTIEHHEYGNYLIFLYNILNAYLTSETPQDFGRIFKIRLDEIVGRTIWEHPIIEQWNADENQVNIKTACQHLFSIFTNEVEDNNMMNWLDNQQNLMNLNRDYRNIVINRYSNTSNIVNYNDTRILLQILQYTNNVSHEHILLIKNYEHLLGIYSDLIEIIKCVNSIEETGFSNQQSYLNFIFQEYLNICSLATRIYEKLGALATNQILLVYFDKMIYLHIKFRDYIQPFIADINTDTFNSIINNRAPVLLRYLLSDIKAYNTYIKVFYIDKADAAFMSLGQNGYSYNWPIINFNTLEIKEITSNNYASSSNDNASSSNIERTYTFQEKIDILKLRRMVTQYSVSRIFRFLFFTQNTN